MVRTVYVRYGGTGTQLVSARAEYSDWHDIKLPTVLQSDIMHVVSNACAKIFHKLVVNSLLSALCLRTQQNNLLSSMSFILSMHAITSQSC